jgi:hypothetical protein
VILWKGLPNPMVVLPVCLLHHPLLLIGNVVYLSDHLFEVGIIIVLALQGCNPYPLCLPSYLLVEGKIDCKTIWNCSSWDQDS